MLQLRSHCRFSQHFVERKSDIVFSAELFCWPYQDYADKYPTRDSGDPYKYLNSGGFMGSLLSLLRMFDIAGPVANRDDDQVRYIYIYIY